MPGPAAAGLLDALDRAEIERGQAVLRIRESAGRRLMVALHRGRTDNLEVSPNLWAGMGLVRGGVGTALVGSHTEVADRIGEGVLPELARRGLLAEHP